MTRNSVGWDKAAAAEVPPLPLSRLNAIGSFASATDPLLADLVEQLTDRLAAGDESSVETLLADHPDHFERLQKLLPTLRVLAAVGWDSVVGTLRVPSSSNRASTANDGTRSVPTTLGDFRLLREIGRGGMGVVYEAEQISLRRKVALKMLPLAGMLDERALTRFRNEAQAAAGLAHPNIVPIYAVGCERGVHYYAMQYIDGLPLDRVIAGLREHTSPTRERGNGVQGSGFRVQADSGRGTGDREQGDGDPISAASNPKSEIPNPKSPADTAVLAALSTEREKDPAAFFRRVAELGIQAAEALHHAHELGIIHRDIKPGNLLLDSSGKLWITDFGLARIEGADNLTLTGDLLGTLRYMSPEQAGGQTLGIDQRTDIYSLGVTLYELLTLEPAVGGNGRERLLRQISEVEPRAPSQYNGDIPSSLETIVVKAIAKESADRYSAACDLADDLQRFLNRQPIRARRTTLRQQWARWSRRHRVLVRAATIALVVVAALAVSAAWWLDKARREARAEQRIREVERARLDDAEGQLKEQNYVAQMCVAAHAYDRHDLNQVESILQELLPKPNQRDQRGFEFDYLWNLVSHRPRPFHAHRSEAYCARFSPDGRQLATAGGDGVKIWKWPSRILEIQLKDNLGDVNGVEWSADSQLLATASDDTFARVYRTSDWTLAGYHKFDGPLVSAVFASNNQRLLIAERRWVQSAKKVHGDNRIHLLDLSDWQRCGELRGPAQTLQALAVSPDGRWAGAASEDETSFVWDLRTNELRHRLDNYRPPSENRGWGGTGLAFSHDSLRLAVTSSAGAVRIFAAASGQLLGELPPQGGAAEGVTFTPDDRALIVVGRGRQAVVWEETAPNTWRESNVLAHPHPLWSVAAHPDGSFVTTGRDGALWAHDRFSLLDRRRLTADTPVRPAITTSFETAGQASTAQVGVGHPVASLAEKPDRLLTLAWSPDGRELAVAGQPGNVSVWDLVAGARIDFFPTRLSRITAIAYSTSGHLVAIGSSYGEIQLRERQGWRLVASTKNPKGCNHLAFSNGDRQLIASVGYPDVSLIAWQAPALRRMPGSVQTVRVQQCWARSASGCDFAFFLERDGTADFQPTSVNWTDYRSFCAVSADSQVIAMYLVEDRLQVWSRPAWQCRSLFAGTGEAVHHMALSPDGRTLGALTIDGHVNLFNTFTGRLLLTLKSRLEKYSRIGFSPDGRHLVAIGQGLRGQPEVVVWDAPGPER